MASYEIHRMFVAITNPTVLTIHLLGITELVYTVHYQVLEITRRFEPWISFRPQEKPQSIYQ